MDPSTLKAVLAGLCILITELALIASHATYASPWWRTPMLWTDRWHILSFLSHFPIICLVLWLAVPSAYWTPLAVASWAGWQWVKILAGKQWDPQGVQIWNWLRRNW